MNYLSLFSGIEAATVAWHGLGWMPTAFAELDDHSSAVLRYHWPDTTNHRDVTTHDDWPDYADLPLLVGGSPCQAFSVAGLRKGLADPRGNLTLTFLAVVNQYRPRWVVWENVPGVLSDRTGAFGSFVGGLAELGYGWAYRVLDAQYFGVPQRRRRVFVVGHFGDWRRAAAVLFERESLSRHSPPRKEKGAGATAFTPSSFGNWREGCGTLRANGGDLGGGSETAIVRSIAEPWHCHGSNVGPMGTLRAGNGNEAGGVPFVIKGAAIGRKPENGPQWGEVQEDGPCYTLNTVERHGDAVPQPTTVHGSEQTPPLVARGASRVGNTQDGLNDVQPVAFTCKDDGRDATADLSPTLRSMNNAASNVNGGGQVGIALFDTNPTLRANAGALRDEARTDNVVINPTGHQGDRIIGEDGTWPTLPAQGANNGGGAGARLHQPHAYRVRRLTPVECERLQGFPDEHTRFGRKEDGTVYEQSDTQRYRQLGNSMAVPVMAWIGQRIQMVEDLLT